MSQHNSPSSSASVGPSSSPFAGTDPTLYSPDLARSSKHRRDNVSNVTIVAGSAKKVVEKLKVLPGPSAHALGAFLNELAEDDHNNFISRSLFVSQLPDGTPAGVEQDHELFIVQHQMKLYACFGNCVPTYSHGVYLRFDDLREASEAKDILQQHGFAIHYITGYQYALAKSQDTTQIEEFEGQIEISVMIDPNPDHAIWEFTKDDLADMTNIIDQICAAFGPVRNCVHVASIDAKMQLTFRIEFYSVDAAHRAAHSMLRDPTWGMNYEQTFQWVTLSPAKWSGERPPNSPHRTKPAVDDEGRFIGYRAAGGMYRGNMFCRHPADQHNRVLREHILDGSDVRTTIMLRNIPNKLDWMSLKTILDDACFGTYDFVYLRIDFKSGCNVGYAFINFSDANGMIALMDKIERRPWAGYRSGKAAEISYATIQGREALVQKFRNSSVMQETPFCRPRLFVTYVDAELVNMIRSTGTEQAFPRPDNLSKLQRSMDSARTIGLFPPHGYGVMALQRGRTSAYDRGTPRDMLQTASQFPQAGPSGYYGAMTAPTGVLTDAQKRDIETWYGNNYGQGANGPVPFAYIPMSHITLYFSQQTSSTATLMAINAPSNVGIIGGPARRSHQDVADAAAAAAATPTRAARVEGSRTYTHPVSGASMSFANPFQ